MNALINFECSGIVRTEFRAMGVDAWSCDLKAAEDDSPYHIRGDAVAAMRSRRWDFMIAHPPCDFLTVSGNAWFSDTVLAGEGILTGAARRKAQSDSVALVRLLWDADIPCVAIENPIGRLSTLWRKPTQTIQPTQFGAPFRKATCLWLRGLPPLQPTHTPNGDLFLPPEPIGAQACWKMPPSKTRKADRARTYPEIARAMATQWIGVQVAALTVPKAAQ